MNRAELTEEQKKKNIIDAQSKVIKLVIEYILQEKLKNPIYNNSKNVSRETITI